MTASPAERRPPVFGPEPWSEVGGQSWCHFDRWFALVASTDFDGDADALRGDLETRLQSLHGRHDVVAKLSHLADLRRRVAEARLSLYQLASVEPADPATLAKARRKVLTQTLEGRAMTDAMRDTPAARLARRARSGHWSRFPSDPHRFYVRLASRRDNHVTKGGSFRVVDEHRRRLDRLDGPRRSIADRLALYRAFHTVGIELAERADDSYGVVGELRADAYHTYLAIDWAATGMDCADYWQDLCELLVTEIYGLTYRDETVAFAQATADDVPMIESILHGLEAENRVVYQPYQADQAVALIAWCHIATRGYDRYVEVARRLGSHQWILIDALARSALDAGGRDLAIEVFHAADRPGLQREHLRRLCRELTGIELADRSDDRPPA
jgi:hypothetical protein